ncbi:hypothetical protein BCE_1122 [Bacillus cereus ATCC 10987]|uniref:Uncharacterized protein n=1 Tax=Bacillus cereus (strain ATCC 10987 / NRS 248) TaxID=222523 RepID=Q73CE3_BACC1|nr:hypothetical protein BCE_1122 [Bacillus cereus ATCC 10987]
MKRTAGVGDFFHFSRSSFKRLLKIILCFSPIYV